MTHEEFANDLRQIADFIEAHPEIDLPEPILTSYGLHSKEKARITARALADGGRCDKVFEDTLVTLKRMFGSIEMRYLGCRSNVCEQVKVGTKIVPEQYVAPRPAVEAHTVPEHEEAVYEWVCAPLLGKPSVEIAEEHPAITDGSIPMLEAEYVDIPF